MSAVNLLGASRFSSCVTDKLGAAIHDSFVQHAADMSMARHTTGPRATDLRDPPDRLWVVFIDGRPNFVFGHVQAMTD